MIDIAAAISSTSTLLGIAKGALAARDDAKAQQAITDVQLKLLDVSTAALSLSQTNIALTDEIRLLKDQAHQAQMKTRDRDGYEIAEVCPGAHAYKSKPAKEGASVPLHYLCQPCYDKGVKAMLRFHQTEGWGKEWACPENEAHNIRQYG